MRFLEGELLWHLLWAAPLFLGLAAFAWTKRAKLLEKLFGAEPDGHVKLSKTARAVRLALLLAALLLLALAAARPSWGSQLLPSGGSGRDVLVVFDVSKSMLCKDVQPSRLEHGKWLARELAKRSRGDRFGLVAFAGTAFLECPLTSDRSSFIQALNELNVESIPVGGTNIQNALETSFKAFQAAESGHRAIVLVTDGDELEGDLLKVVATAKELKIPLFVAGVGDPSQPAIVQAPDEEGALRTVKDESGAIVKSNLNEKGLSELALGTGGVYVRSTASNTGLSEIASRIERLVPKSFELGQQTRPIERFAAPLSIAFALLLLWLCLSERGSAKRAALLLASLCLLSTESFADDNAKNESAKAPEKSAKAVAPGNPVSTFNKAVELQTAGKDPDEAAKLYSSALEKAPASEKELLARSSQNLGVIVHEKAREGLDKAQNEDLKNQQLDKAEKSVDASLKTFDEAEGLYCEGLRSTENPSKALKSNQQALLLDREAAAKLKQQIQDLKKQLEQAKKDIQQAQKDQQQNQKQSQQKNQQQQGQQGEQQGQQSQTQQAAQNAKDSVDKLKDQASELQQQKLEQAADKSSKEIEKAQQAEKQGESKQAEKHLENAMKQLEQASQEQKNEEKKESSQQEDGQGKQGDNAQNQPDKKLEKRQAQPKDGAKPQEEKEISPDQADSVLASMANEEKNLRDAIKRKQREAYGVQRVEKDW